MCSPVTDYMVDKIKEQEESVTDYWNEKAVLKLMI